MKISLLSGVIAFCLFQASIQVPSAIEKVNDELIEDDMRFTPEQRAFMKTSAQLNENGLISPFKKWPNNVVRYELVDNILTPWSEEDRLLIKTTLKHLEEKISSCLKFEEASYGSRIVIQGVSSEGCWSNVGFYSSKNTIMNLSPFGCMESGTIEHEFLHALGIFHHHNRPDRDQYVRILEKNILKEKRYNFEKKSPNVVETFDIPYDYQSIMHYGSNYWAVNPDENTIETLDPTKQGLIGNRDGVTESDILLIKRMYKCEETTTPTPTVTVDCVEDTWRCPEDNLCYLNSWWCDGIDDCMGIDEGDCANFNSTTTSTPTDTSLVTTDDNTISATSELPGGECSGKVNKFDLFCQSWATREYCTKPSNSKTFAMKNCAKSCCIKTLSN